MRQRFEQQTALGISPIKDVTFPLRSRDELPPVLKALHYIFMTPELNEKAFQLIENKVCSGKKKTGRKGMDLWHILVLAVVRHTLDTNWDRLEDMANYHDLLRSVMGVKDCGWEAGNKIEFPYQTIVDNVSLIDEDLLQKLNELVVDHGHALLKKKEEALRLKTDSFVLETNVHYPTDLNITWDCIRKGLDTVECIKKIAVVTGWRKIKMIHRQMKSLFRSTSFQVFKGKDEKKKKESVLSYLNEAKKLHERFNLLIETPLQSNNLQATVLSILQLEKYNKYLEKLIDLTERRLIKGEQIPASEKIHSIFEPHTEWITKGKMNPRFELGHLMLITTDQFHFIIDYKVMENEKDPVQVKPLMERIKNRFPDVTLYSHSFDKGFYSLLNYETLQKAEVENIIMPKKGKLNNAEKERESHKIFKALRDDHSAVESNINMLEHHGLNRCPDRGIKGYKRYVGLSVLAYNLHILGNHLISVERKKEEQKKKRRKKYHRQAA